VPRLVPAERVAAAAPSSLALRILSSLVLAPIAVAAAWFGWPWLPIAVAVAGAVMAWEWAKLCGGGKLGGSGHTVISFVLFAVLAAAFFSVPAGIALIAVGAAVIWAVGRWRTRSERVREPGWLAAGMLWIGLPCVLLLWLARPEAGGRATVLWIFAIVWATDIGAYAFGRLIGGRRLAPRWSPGKTWAGLVGGIICAGLAGWGAAGLLGVPALPLVLPSAGLAIVGQFGDLAESVAKRRFGVKDSSGLIPGHGGLLDRLDGLLAVIPAVALLTLIGGNVLTWR
jgi:phosphatidate cytidylyltransferase